MREGEIGEGKDSEKMNQCLKITKYEICEWMETIICLIGFVYFDFFFFFGITSLQSVVENQFQINRLPTDQS